MFKPVEMDQLQAGMIVARDVMAQGSLLVQAGATLTDQMIGVLKRRGVEEVCVTTLEEDARRRATEMLEAADLLARTTTKLSLRGTERLNAAIERINALFQGYDQDPVMAPFKAAVLAHWQKKVSGADPAMQNR